MMKSAALHRKSYSILTFVLICFSGSILLLLRGFNGEAKNKIHPSDPTISAVSLLSHQTEMLNNDQLNRLDAIRSGSLTRENIEIVLSRYNEDISWSDMYSSLRTVYDKSGDTGSLATGTAGKVVKLPNLGRESHTYLQHIVRNYDNLATVTVFSQASQPTHGYMGHRKGGGHLIANSSFHDFVLNPTGHFIFSGAIWLPSLAHLLRSGFNSKSSSRWQSLQRCPSPMLTETGGSEYRFDLEDRNHFRDLSHMASRCSFENSSTCSGYSFWNKFIKLPYPKESILFFAQGATFSVTDQQIRIRSLEEYKILLAEVSQNEDPSAGFFLEWMWYYLLTSEISPCPVSGHEFDWAKVQPYYKTLELPERILFTPEIIANLLKRPRYSKKVKFWPSLGLPSFF